MQKMMTKLLQKRYGVLFLSSYKTISKTFPLIFFIFPLVFCFFPYILNHGVKTPTKSNRKRHYQIQTISHHFLPNTFGKEPTLTTILYVVTRNHGDERQTDIYSAMLEERAIFINGAIDDDTSSAVTAEFLFLEASAPDRPISLYINSPGGSVTAGLAIYNTIRHVRCKVHLDDILYRRS